VIPARTVVVPAGMNSRLIFAPADPPIFGDGPQHSVFTLHAAMARAGPRVPEHGVS
jgi:hypothetical protein